MDNYFDSVMIDWETMGTGPRAAVVQLGAVLFNFHTGAMSPHPFFRDIDLVSSINAGGYCDRSTQEWWREQGGFKYGTATGPKDVTLVITDFARWLRGSGAPVGKSPRIWAHGPSFDVAIMEHHCHCLSLPVPWPYHMPRDTRTVYDLARERGWEKEPGVVAHHALQDCAAQIKMLMSALTSIRGLIDPPGE